MPILLKKKGNQGPEVEVVQNLLMNKGFLTDEEVNGIFDNETYRAVRAFQVILTPSAVDNKQMPDIALGGSQHGRAASQTAINELKAGAGEIGGNNSGPFVKKYLHGMLPEGNPWSAGFVSYCFSQNPAGMPFPYTLGAREILRIFQARGWANKPNSGYLPKPGDVVVRWRDQPSSGKGHIGLVH